MLLFFRPIARYPGRLGSELSMVVIHIQYVLHEIDYAFHINVLPHLTKPPTIRPGGFRGVYPDEYRGSTND